MKCVPAIPVLMMLGCAFPEPAESDWGSEIPPADRLQLRCIFALDDRTAWLGGGVYDDVWVADSVMFVTRNGGKTWRPTGPAVHSSEIFSIFFLDEETGWAAGAWTTESTGEPFVLRTVDGGGTWHRSDIPLDACSSPLLQPTSIEFVTKKHGILRAEVVIAEDEEEVFVTQDGGRTWEFSHGRLATSGNANRLSVTSAGVIWRLDDDDRVVRRFGDFSPYQETESQPVARPPSASGLPADVRFEERHEKDQEGRTGGSDPGDLRR